VFASVLKPSFDLAAGGDCLRPMPWCGSDPVCDARSKANIKPERYGTAKCDNSNNGNPTGRWGDLPEERHAHHLDNMIERIELREQSAAASQLIGFPQNWGEQKQNLRDICDDRRQIAEPCTEQTDQESG
jgi:hypothetical protein